jgi:hypothetical protein
MARWSAKLPTASVTASWSLDDLPDPPAFWRSVAETTARHLSSADSDAVAAAIETYVRETEDETTAVPVGSAQARVVELRRAASAFAQALAAPRTPAAAQAETLIEDMAEHDRTASFRVLSDSTHAFVAACDRALAQLEALREEGHFAPGEAWARFIAALAGAFEKATGRAATAAKDRSVTQTSPFVRFAHAIQMLLPPRFWRHPVATPESRPAPEPSVTFNEAVAKVLAARRAAAQTAPPADQGTDVPGGAQKPPADEK